MHVCRVCQEFYPKEFLKSGIAPHFYYLTKELEKLGVEHTIITPSTTSTEVKGTRVYKINPSRPFTILRTGLEAFKKIKMLNENFDLIHYHNPAFFALNFKRGELKIPIIQTIHGSPTRIMKNIFLHKSLRSIREGLYFSLFSVCSLKSVDATITVSSEERENLIKYFHANPERIFHIPPGVNLDVFFPTKVEKDIDILYVGRFAPKKRLVDILLAIKILKDELPAIKAYLIGGTKEDYSFNETIELIKKLNLSKNVAIEPPLQHTRLANFYNRSKIFVLASVEEGLPKVILEAMACGLPVVATSIAGNKDAVINEKTGFLVNTKNPGELAARVKILLNDENLREEMGRFGKERVKYFTWKNIAKQHLDVYKKMI